jgi:hypothetical protein
MEGLNQAGPTHLWETYRPEDNYLMVDTTARLDTYLPTALNYLNS